MYKNPYGGVPKVFFFIYKKKIGVPMGTPIMGALWVSILGALWASILGTLRASISGSILGPLRASILGALRATMMVMWISNYSHVYPFSKRINSLLHVACEPTGQM